MQLSPQIAPDNLGDHRSAGREVPAGGVYRSDRGVNVTGCRDLLVDQSVSHFPRRIEPQHLDDLGLILDRATGGDLQILEPCMPFGHDALAM